MATRRSTSERTGQKNRKTGKGSIRPKKNGFGNFCLVLQALASLAFMGVVILLDMLPLKYLGLVAMILFFLWCITFLSQAARKKRGIAGKLYSLLVIAVLAVGTYYVAKTNNMISMITSGGVKVDRMVVAVLADDPAETLEDAADYSYGVQFAQGAENMQSVVLDIQNQLGTDINMTEYESVQEQAQALTDGEVQAIVYNQSYTDLMDEAVEGYSSQIKVIYSHEIETKLDLGGSEEDDILTKEPFAVYIGGMDVYGDDRDTGYRDTEHGDVNIIAVVNPTTHQILLVTTPRDYFVPIPGVSGGMNDKLTHAATYGIDASMATLEELYEIDINYYVKMNFSALIEIVDILGGVDVYSESAFTTSENSEYVMDVQEGYNHFTGEQALAFSRERENLPGGDNHRGRNQQAVITAMLKKALSPTMLLKADRIINQVSNDIETNVTQGQLNSLVKYQLESGAKWTIQSVAATGYDGEDYPYSMPDSLVYVMYPDEGSINEIIHLVNVVEEGRYLTEGEELN